MYARVLIPVLLAGALAAPAAARGDDATADEPAQLYGASSLTNALQTLAANYEAATGFPAPRLTFAGSSRLARQVEAGAPADVVLTADEAWMDTLQEKGLVVADTRTVLLTNRLVVVVPEGSPLQITAPKQLVTLRQIAVAGQAVPAGRRAREALTHHQLLDQVEPHFVQAPNVRAALALVARGEVDAGIVYATDAEASDGVTVAFRFDPSAHSPIRYPIALTPAGKKSEPARALYAFLRSAEARPVFEAAGFGTPLGSAGGVEQGTGGPVHVAAASSLTDVLQILGAEFAKATGAPAPRISFAGSSKLARQVQEGSPAEVILTADEKWMDVLADGNLLLEGTRRTLLTNRLVAAIPKGAAFRPQGPEQLLDPRAKLIAVAGAPVPAGRRAREALTHYGLLERAEPRFVQSPNVRSALALVARGEVDVGIVYATDAAASPDVEVAFAFDRAAHSPIRYPVALTAKAAGHPDARAFYEFLQGDEARARFAAAGFRIPGSRRSAGSNTPAAAPSSPAPRPTPNWFGPVALSVWVATLSLLLSLGPAIFLGWLLARRDFPGKALLSTALLTPLVLPPVVTGYLLLGAFGRNGPFAGFLEAVGLQVAFSRWGAVLAAAVVGFPLLIIMTRTAIDSVDPRYEQLAETLGLHPLAAFFKVTLPMAIPGLLSGCVLAFARALGEFGATAILASDVPGETRTLALAVFALYEEPGGEDAASLLVWISVGLCLFALIGYERLTAAQQRRITERPK